MASITPTEFRARRSEFSNITDYPDATVQIHIDDTECEMDEALWGCFFAKGQSFLVAHYLALDDMLTANGSATDSSGGQEAHGRLTGESEGDTSVSYAAGTSSSGGFAGAGTDELLASTTYGQAYIELRSKAILGIASSGSTANASARC